MYAYPKLSDPNEVLTIADNLMQIALFLENHHKDEAAQEIHMTALSINEHKNMIMDLAERVRMVVYNAELWQNGSGNETYFDEQFNNWKAIRKNVHTR